MADLQEIQTFKINKKVKVVRRNPDNIRSVPSNDLLITHSRNEFFLTFSILEPPAVLDELELEQLQEVEAITRCKLVISPEFAEAIVKTLSINIDSYKQKEKKDASKKKIK